MYIGCHVKCRYYGQILMELEFSRHISEKKTQIPNFTKIRPVGAELFHAERWTDMKRLIVAFRNFANAPKKLKHASTRLPYCRGCCFQKS